MNIAAWQEIKGTGTARDLDLILRVLDMVVPNGEGSYLAAPISSGRRYYQQLAHNQLSTFQELIDRVGEREYLRTVRWPNVADGEQAASGLRDNGVKYLINTGPLMISNWHGSDYMDACFALIEKKVRCVYFHPEWALSSGAVKEFVFCTQRRIPCRSLDGRNLALEEARLSIMGACQHLRSLRLSAAKFEAKLDELDALAKSRP
jgi:hypothetical protein